MFDADSADEPLRELRRTLRALAAAGFDQPVLFPEQSVSASRLARDFDQQVSVVREAHDAELSPLQLESLTSLSQKLETMSTDGAEFDADIWTEAAVRTSEHWAEVRRLAAAALDTFAAGDE